MNVSRRNKLTALTRGAAVVGIGIASAACTKSGGDPQPPVMNGPQPPTMNATAQPPTINAPPSTVDAAASDPTSDNAPNVTGDGGMPIRRFPIPNALRPRGPADGG